VLAHHGSGGHGTAAASDHAQRRPEMPSGRAGPCVLNASIDITWGYHDKLDPPFRNKIDISTSRIQSPEGSAVLWD